MGKEAGDWLDGRDHQRIYRRRATPSDPHFGNSLGRMNQEERQEEGAKDNGQVLCKQGSSDSWHQGHLGGGPQNTHVCLRAQSLQSCLALCDPMDCSPPGSSVPGISLARILDWVAISFPRESS